MKVSPKATTKLEITSSKENDDENYKEDNNW